MPRDPQQHIRFLERRVREADGDLHAAVKTSPAWRVTDDLLQTVPGVGRVVSLTHLAELPELGRLIHKVIACRRKTAHHSHAMGRSRQRHRPECPEIFNVDAPAIETHGFDRIADLSGEFTYPDSLQEMVAQRSFSHSSQTPTE